MVMMKHLQEPVPSVLEERPDIPASVGRVVARAMAKVRDNRYQTVAELIEDLTIAAGMTIHRIGPVTATNTGQTAPVPDDEVTMVRPRAEAAYVPPAPVARREPVRVPVSGAMPPPQAASGFNPLKIIIPSLVGLLVVFAAMYALTRNSGAGEVNTNQQTQTLAADPNSQPVQPGQSPSGKGEQGIPAGGTITAPANVNASANANANAAVSPAAVEVVSPAANANVNENSNSNSNRKAPALPEPTKSVLPDNPPPPAPSASKPPAEKPSPTATPIN
jgi:hypothetical protein